MLAQKVSDLAVIVDKIEALDIHVIDASASHFDTPALGVRIAVRGGNAALVAITDFVAQSVVDPVRFAGEINNALLVTNVMIDGLVVHIAASSTR